MKYISSDTNIWLDFYYIDKIKLPFRLSVIFLISSQAAKEIISPPSLKDELISFGLEVVSPTTEEDKLALIFRERYSQCTHNDCLALAMAKIRDIPILTGDKALRKAAAKEGVQILGTIGIIDQLLEDGFISAEEACECFEALLVLNQNKIRRLPQDILEQRIKKLKEEKTFKIQLSSRYRRFNIIRAG